MNEPLFKIARYYAPATLVMLALAEFFILTSSQLYVEWHGTTITHIEMPARAYTPAALNLYLMVKALLFAGVMFMSLICSGLYWPTLSDNWWMTIFRTAAAFILGGTVFSVLCSQVSYLACEWKTILYITGTAFLGILIIRILYMIIVRCEFLKRRTLVLGAGNNAKPLETLDLSDIHLVGNVPLAGQQVIIDKQKILCSSETLYEMAHDLRIQEIVVALDQGQEFPVADLLECKMKGIKVIDLLNFYESRLGQIKLSVLYPSHLVFTDGFHRSLLTSTGKRLIDITVSMLLLVLASPIMLLTVLGIFLESHGRAPILYRQVRVGKDGVHFPMLKFRTMIVDAEQDGTPVWAKTNDPRVTRIGRILRKFRIDELPQLINVIRGEMSVVGPRPERPAFVERLATEIPYYRLRHLVKPGITGWAQIAYPYGASVEDALEKLQYDLYYIKNYSILYDFYILLQTVPTVLWGRGAR